MAFKKKWANESGTKTYYAWRSMVSRCSNSSNPSWSNYGGRGIDVCERWRASYDNFVEDMGFAEEGKSLDRIDPNDGYHAGNCRWATSEEQARNKRTSRLISHGGRTMNLVDWAAELGIETDTLFKRLERMSIKKALSHGLMSGRLEHGTRTAYERRGCRCAACRKANADRHRIARAERKRKQLENAG